MNLSDITTKPWILALFKRDDGERFLLGDGFYDFKDSLQHFQPNTLANDIVELQGTDGQLLAGQVRRGASQSFDGVIGDGTTTKKVVEERRRDFLMFFRKKHFYTVIYIFCDGTAIKRERGYLVDAPSVPELYQVAPTYHVALNFENVNYYEYREDGAGNEIFSNIRNVVVSTLMTGGLIWDNLGAVSEALQWAGEQTAQGAYITINDGLQNAPMTLTKLSGNATQASTPTPSSPVPVQTVTGEQTVKLTGKNLFDYASASDTANTSVAIYRLFKIDGLDADSTYTFSGLDFTSALTGQYVYLWQEPSYPGGLSRIIATPNEYKTTVSSIQPSANGEIYVAIYPNDTATWDALIPKFKNAQIEKGTATTYEPYQSQSKTVNLGKNLFDNSTLYHGYYQPTDPYLRSADEKYRTVDMTLPAGTYTFSCDLENCYILRWLGDNTNTAINQTASTLTFTTTASGRVMICFRNTNTTTITQDVKCQVEAGSKATTYAPYFTPIELAKIPNTTYEDYIWNDNGTWKVHKAVGKVVFRGDNSEGWSYVASNDGYFQCSYTGAVAFDGNPSTNAFCSHFTPRSRYFVAGVGKVNLSVNLNGSYAAIRYQAYSDADSFKTWLSNNPTTVYYALATATDTAIANQTLIDQLNAVWTLFGGQNNIMLIPSAGAQGTMEISYYTELQPGGGFEWEDGGTGGATIINVEGVDAASPIWTIKGSATNPTLTNITTGQTITWTGTVPSGQTLIIDMDKQTATMEGANVFAFISGDWLDLAPGINRITYSVLGTDQPSTLSWNNIVG